MCVKKRRGGASRSSTNASARATVGMVGGMRTMPQAHLEIGQQIMQAP